MTDSSYDKLLNRVVSDPKIDGGEPCIRGTRIHVAVILDSLAEGLSPVGDYGAISTAHSAGCRGGSTVHPAKTLRLWQ